MLSTQYSVESHQFAVVLPEATNRRFGHQMCLAADVASAQFDEGAGLPVAHDRLLHQLDRVPVFQRDESGRPDQVGLFDTHRAHLLVVILIAQEGEYKLESIRPFWP